MAFKTQITFSERYKNLLAHLTEMRDVLSEIADDFVREVRTQATVAASAVDTLIETVCRHDRNTTERITEPDDEEAADEPEEPSGGPLDGVL